MTAATPEGERFGEDADLGDLLREMKRQGADLVQDVGDVAREWFDKAEYEVDKVLARQLAKHPDLYADLKRMAKKAKRSWERFERDLRRS